MRSFPPTGYAEHSSSLSHDTIATGVLAIIASNEPSGPTRQSLESQTIAPARIVVADRTFNDRIVGVRIAKAINTAIDNLDLAEFDWFLRVDGDMILPPEWVEKSLASGADVVGRGGYALLIRMSAFVALGSHWPIIAPEDSFIILKLQSLGFKTVPYVVRPRFLREPSRGTSANRSSSILLKYGVWKWKLGYESIHAVYDFVFATNLRRNPRYLLGIFRYFFAALSRTKKWDEGVARFVWREQTRRLL